jgi:hypothetical protein
MGTTHILVGYRIKLCAGTVSSLAHKCSSCRTGGVRSLEQGTQLIELPVPTASQANSGFKNFLTTMQKYIGGSSLLLE